MAAISKDQVLADSTQKYLAEYQALEKRINEALTKDYPEKDKVTINGAGVSRVVRARVFEEYRLKGWTVGYTSNEWTDSTVL